MLKVHGAGEDLYMQSTGVTGGCLTNAGQILPAVQPGRLCPRKGVPTAQKGPDPQLGTGAAQPARSGPWTPGTTT